MWKQRAMVLWALVSGVVFGAGIEDLSPVQDWEPWVPGVWRARIGQPEAELRYTDLAAEPPRVQALADLPVVAFPLEDGAVSARLDAEGRIAVRIATDPDERLYGFGLQFDGVRKSGQVMTLNVDHWSRGGGRTHAPVPFYLSSRGYGVFFNTARFLKVYVQVGVRKDAPRKPPTVDRNPLPDEPQPGPWQSRPPADAVEASLHGRGLELVVLGGPSLLHVVQRYNLLNGGGALPPLWGLGFWHRVPARFTAAQTRAEVAAFAEQRMPLDVIGLEPGWMTKSYPCTFEWNRRRFPEPGALSRELLDQGIHLNLWENPYVSPAARLYRPLYPLSGSHLVWMGLVPDYTLPAARRLLTEQHARDHLAIGISGYKIDEVDGYDQWLWPDHATFPSGTPAETMRQTYGLLLQRMLYQELFRTRNVRTYGLVRASNGGGSGYPFAIYSDSYSHAQYITGLSAASLCGILWAPETRSAGSPREWLNRIATSCFSPLAMLNAWSSGRKPWSYPEVTDAVRAHLELRQRLLPYLYTAFARYQREGIPPVRATLLESGTPVRERVVAGRLDGETNPYAEGQVLERNDEYLFGDTILVAPFYERQAERREVVLPAGTDWHDFYTGRRQGGGTTVTVTAAQTGDRIPLFVKTGAVIPLLTTPVAQAEQARGHNLELRVYGDGGGGCTVYEDDGRTFDYQRGAYRLRHITVTRDGEGTLKATETVTGPGPALFGPVTRVTAVGTLP